MTYANATGLVQAKGDSVEWGLGDNDLIEKRTEGIFSRYRYEGDQKLNM